MKELGYLSAFGQTVLLMLRYFGMCTLTEYCETLKKHSQLPENIQYTMSNCDLSTKAIVFPVIFFVKKGKRHDVLILHDT